MNNRFKRIAAFALGLGGGIAAGYLSRPSMRNKLREQIITDDPKKKDGNKQESQAQNRKISKDDKDESKLEFATS